MSNFDTDLVAVAEARRPSVVAYHGEKDTVDADTAHANASREGLLEPTAEELKTLRRVGGSLPWQAFTVTFVEFAERFSYYGTTAVFVNFLQQGRPYGSRTGAIVETQACYDAIGREACVQPGGPGQGQQAATALTTFNSFWAYLMPLRGGYVADTYLGRYNTVQYSICFSIVGHIILMSSSIPSVMDHPQGALGCFAVGLIIMGMGTGGFKSNISPLLAEQIPQTRPFVKTVKSGERVIQDPQVTISRVFLYFYMMWVTITVAIDSTLRRITYRLSQDQHRQSSRRHRNGLRRTFRRILASIRAADLRLHPCTRGFDQLQEALPLESSDWIGTSRAFKLLALASKGCWSPNPIRTYRNFQREGFWDMVKPSYLGASAPAWMDGIDDVWVEQVTRGFNACKVFTWLPYVDTVIHHCKAHRLTERRLYWLAYNQMVNNLR
ncbi:hypothetical protein LTR53_007540 [Teratosphaeriaceae sp. CCFEE 6253]|nr:hypothetical protein LTR53_007540 [Teratosphaeriaceae sp. CCFEE 6253]